MSAVAPDTAVVAPEHRRLLAAGMLCYGFDALDFMMLAMAMPLLIVEWHLTLGQAGLLGTAGMIGVGLSGLVLGWYSDRHGRRRALLVSVVVFAVFTAAIAFAHSPLQVMVLRFLAGFGIGGVWGAVTALVKESWPAGYRVRAISWVLAAFPLGVIAAAVLAWLLLPRYGWRPMFLCGALALLSAWYASRVVPESAAWQAARRAPGCTSRVSMLVIFSSAHRWHTVCGTLVAASGLTAYWGINTWLPTYLVRVHGLPPAATLQCLLLLNAGMFCGYPVLAATAGRFGKYTVLVASFTLAALMVPLYAQVRDATVLLWLGPVMAAGFAQTGLLGAYFPELFPTHMRSFGAGFCFNAGRGVAAFSPYLFGELATHLGLARSIALCGIGYLVAALFMLLLPRNPAFGDSDARSADSVAPAAA
jgi:predicted MFS family arabinose efflux permease